ncbi:ABC transporter substrate-binding protein [Pararhodobacter oceanensis]|uniref:ABC transporter substrate-binding protein n=1 Tax=Pararhodobacter oceanensis TaxID=2172121 RepID=A0A2T8HPN6_9RHOB|nr:ABC transporter substrate-binding protein [Pararhodobacter oceanensis]PVH27409.1 ABC transporter substrate-binding protein [Pararhodobacter oceanensis]
MKTQTDTRKLVAPTRRDILKYGTAMTTLAASGGLAAPALASTGGTIRIGFVSPQTGPLAAFGEADDFVLAGVRAALAEGLVIDGTSYDVEILARDSQSNPSRCAEVTADLILRDEVQLLLGSSTGDTTNPVADQAEIMEVPCITTDTPWEAHFFGRGGNPAVGFDWTYHFFWGLGDMLGVFTDMWDTQETNRSVGAFFTNDVEGVALSDAELGFPRFIREAGYELDLPGLATPMSDEHSAFVSSFASSNIEILTGAVTPPDFATFWSQAAQQGLRQRLKFCTIAKAMLFPAAVESLGDTGDGITTEVWWSPSHPFSSGLTGQSSAELAGAFTAATGRQWTQPIGFKHALLEVAVDVLKRSGNPMDAGAVRDAIAATDYQSVVGPVNWSQGGPTNPIRNVSTTPLVGGQWKLRNGEFKYELEIVNNQRAPGISTTGSLELLS